MLATYGVGRDGLSGEWPAGYDDASAPYTPAWQEAITGVDRRLAVKVAREFARNAEVSGGRSMNCMGAGTNHWFHSDETYRSFLALLILGGCVGINGGGWAHSSGRRRSDVRGLAADRRRAGLGASAAPGAGHVLLLHAHRAVALRPPAPGALRLAARYRRLPRDDRHRRARQGGAHGLDAGLPAVRPQPPRARRRGGGEGRRAGRPRGRRAQARRLRFAVDDPSAPSSFPASSSSGAGTCSAPRARARSTSCTT